MKINHSMKRAGLCAALFTLGMGMALAQSEVETYEVKAGDTLYGISQRHGITVEALRAANPAVGEDNVISIGQQLVIPAAGETVTTTTTTVTTPAQTTTTTITKTVVTRYDVDNTTFLRGDLVVNAGVGVGMVSKRGAKANQDLAVFTQQVSLDYCFNDDVLSGSALGVGVIINNVYGGKFTSNKSHYRRDDLSVLATLSLHHQFVDDLDTYVKLGAGVGVLTDECKLYHEQTPGYPLGRYTETTLANPAFAVACLVGMRYYMGSHWGIYLEAGLPTVSLNHDFGHSYNFATGGLSYRF